MQLVEFVLKEDNITLTHEPTDSGGVEIHAHKGKRIVGRTVFYSPKSDGKSRAMMVWVPEDLRRQGIASRMYSYARHTLGLDIVPSDFLSDLGEKFWTKAHESKLNESPFDEDTTDAVDAWAKKQGYRFLDSGSDARVYIDPIGNTVLKVLVSEMGMDPVSAALGFLSFYKFCQRNPGNPYLPKYDGPPRRAIINGESIIYIRMELLKKLNKLMEDIVDDLITHVDTPWEELGSIIAVSDSTRKMLAGPQNKQDMWHEFYDTLVKVYAYYNKRNPVSVRKKSTAFMWDIASSNVMSRNHVPVITDPYISD